MEKSTSTENLRQTQQKSGLSSDEVNTGVRDEHFDIVSVLYHALEGADACAVYCEDARKAGDSELAEFFGQLQEEQKRLSDRAMRLLVKRAASKVEKSETLEQTRDQDVH